MKIEKRYYPEVKANHIKHVKQILNIIDTSITSIQGQITDELKIKFAKNLPIDIMSEVMSELNLIPNGEICVFEFKEVNEKPIF